MLPSDAAPAESPIPELLYTDVMSTPLPNTRARFASIAALAAAGMMMAAASLYGSTAGPEAGSAIPSFEAVDQAGETRSFEDLTGENGLLLLFFRSADW